VELTELEAIGSGSYRSRKELAKIAYERISGAYKESAGAED